MSDDLAARVREELNQLKSMPDDDIDLSEMPELTPEQWARSVPNPYYRSIKDQITLRIDRDVIAWFKLTHEKYQTAINAALREHMDRERVKANK